MRTPLLAALLAILAVTRAAAAPAEFHVRPLTQGMGEVLATAIARSAFIRSRVAALDASDLIVYLVESTSPADGRPRAHLRLLSATRCLRFVIVSIDRWSLGPNESIAMLGHELQHAVELAQDPDVRDAVSFGALYRRIGWELERGHYETEAARAATLTVRAEVG